MKGLLAVPHEMLERKVAGTTPREGTATSLLIALVACPLSSTQQPQPSISGEHRTRARGFFLQSCTDGVGGWEGVDLLSSFG